MCTHVYIGSKTVGFFAQYPDLTSLYYILLKKIFSWRRLVLNPAFVPTCSSVQPFFASLLVFLSNRMENCGGKTHDGSALLPGSLLFDELPVLGSRLSSAATNSTLHQFPELAERYRRVMRGDLEQSLIAKAKIIRIFTSSTFTGEKRESYIKGVLRVLERTQWIGAGGRCSDGVKFLFAISSVCRYFK